MSFPKNLLSYNEASRVAMRLRRAGKKIVFASGAYDIPHLGHVWFFEQARQRGDSLFIGVGSDKNIRKQKGPSRPIMNENIRASEIASFRTVDYAVIMKEKMVMPGRLDFIELLRKIKPAVFALNHDDASISEKRALCKKLGIQLVLVNVSGGPQVRTSKIIEAVISKSKLPKLSKSHKGSRHR